MLAELKGKDYYERLRHLNLWTLDDRGNRQDLIQPSRIEIYKRFTKMNIIIIL